MENTNSLLDLIDIGLEDEINALRKKNEFILKLMNEIGTALDENYQKIKGFDLEANLEDFIDLFKYFDSLCQKHPEKSIAIHFISIVILHVNNLDDNYEKLINDAKEIVIQENYLSSFAKRMKVMITLMNDFKPLLLEEYNQYIENYKKLFGVDIAILFELFIYFLTGNSNEELFYFTFKSLKEKYKKLIISDSLFDSKEIKNSININHINQMLLLKFTGEQKIIVFENSHFLIRDANSDELEAYINGDLEQKIKNYSNSLIQKQFYEEKNDSQNIKNSGNVLGEIPNLDPNLFNPVEKYLLDKLKELDKQVKELNKQVKEMKQVNFKLSFKLNLMDLYLKKIKMGSL